MILCVMQVYWYMIRRKPRFLAGCEHQSRLLHFLRRMVQVQRFTQRNNYLENERILYISSCILRFFIISSIVLVPDQDFRLKRNGYVSVIRPKIVLKGVKLRKKFYSFEKRFLIFLVSPSRNTGLPSCFRRSLQPSRENIQHFKS